MGWTCSTYGGRGEVYTEFLSENMRERDNLENPGIGGKIILRQIFKKWVVRHGLGRSGSV
jgi:hypothetical protein